MSRAGGGSVGTDAPMSETDAINALRHEYDLNGHTGWLSTLVWNTRNNYLAWPDGKIEARAVRMIVEGFLAEIATLRAELAGVERAVGEEIDERDRLHELLDTIAYAIAPQSVIGEHSSGNDPWRNALDIVLEEGPLRG